MEDLDVVKMYESEMVLVLPAGHALAGREELHLTDLNGENVVLPDKGSAIYAPLTGYLRYFGVKPRVVAQSSQTDVTLACAENGMAIAFVSETIARKHSGKNTVVRPFRPLIKREVYCAVLKETQFIPAIQTFTKYVKSSALP